MSRSLMDAFKEDPKQLEWSFCLGRYYVVVERNTRSAALWRMFKHSVTSKDKLYIQPDRVKVGDILYFPHEVGKGKGAGKFNVEWVASFFDKQIYDLLENDEKRSKYVLKEIKDARKKKRKKK